MSQPRTARPLLATAARVLVRAGAVVALFLLLGVALNGVERLGGTAGDPAGADIGGGIAVLAVLLAGVAGGAALDGYRRGFSAAATDRVLALALLALTAGGVLVVGTVVAVQDRGLGGMSTGEALTGVGAPLAVVVCLSRSVLGRSRRPARPPWRSRSGRTARATPPEPAASGRTAGLPPEPPGPPPAVRNVTRSAHPACSPSRATFDKDERDW